MRDECGVPEVRCGFLFLLYFAGSGVALLPSQVCRGSFFCFGTGGFVIGIGLGVVFVLGRRSGALAHATLFFFSLFCFTSPSKGVVLFAGGGAAVSAPPLDAIIPVLWDRPNAGVPTATARVRLVRFAVRMAVRGTVECRGT